MKIEKLTENKIRIILKKEDFKDKEININKVLLEEPVSQKLFLEMLTKAEQEVNFDTTGYKLLIEADIQNNDTFIFTITKYLEKDITNQHLHKKNLTIRKRTQLFNTSTLIYNFSSFENFCEFCDFIHSNHTINMKNLYKSAILYFFNNAYYLVIDKINLSNNSMSILHTSLLEFSNLENHTKNFKFKLKEHGKIIMKNNAITTGIQYFSFAQNKENEH